MKRIYSLVSACVFGALTTAALATGALALVPDSQVDRLGADLTPIGAEKAGEDGIPSWTGGLQSAPAGITVTKGAPLQDPFANDPVKFTITSANMGAHDKVLTDGYKKLLQSYPDYKMNVYETRRSCAYSDQVYAATKNNAKVGELVGGGNGVAGAIMGFPFPIPNNALEMIWNHTLRYRGFKFERQFSVAAVTRTGDFTLTQVRDDAIFQWSDPSMSKAEDLNNISFYYLNHTIAPTRLAGNVILAYEAINAAVQPRQAWQYSPGTRRVRRAPNISYDNPGTNSDGLSTSDSFDGYNGAPDRYDWMVSGKAPRIIASNTYAAVAAPFKDFLKPGHINQDDVRYELHRVWEFEAKLKADVRHVYSRRIYHSDEDSWKISSGELYDGRGQIWRVQELHQLQRYDVPLCASEAEVVYDLQAGRYLATAMQNEGPGVNYAPDDLDVSRFTPDAVRQMGVR